MLTFWQKSWPPGWFRWHPKKTKSEPQIASFSANLPSSLRLGLSSPHGPLTNVERNTTPRQKRALKYPSSTQPSRYLHDWWWWPLKLSRHKFRRWEATAKQWPYIVQSSGFDLWIVPSILTNNVHLREWLPSTGKGLWAARRYVNSRQGLETRTELHAFRCGRRHTSRTRPRRRRRSSSAHTGCRCTDH